MRFPHRRLVSATYGSRRTVIVSMLMVLAIVATPRRSVGTVYTWRDGATLHLTNDADAAPPDGSARRFQSVGRKTSIPEVATPSPPMTRLAARAGTRASDLPGRWSAPPPVRPAIVIAPTIVVRAPETRVTVVTGGGTSVPWYGAWDLTGGFTGHEHPQVGFLAGRRLVRHSHFFARGRSGNFTPWGHFTVDGLLVPSVP